jgi:hypothetical protein
MTNPTTKYDLATNASKTARYQTGRRHAKNEFEGTPKDHQEIADLWDIAKELWDDAGFPDMVRICQYEVDAHRRHATIREQDM